MSLTSDLKKHMGGRSLYLIGMMGSGKTSTGRPLAKRLGYGFVDADLVLEEVIKGKIPEFFENNGENEFRVLENQILSSIT